MAAEKKKLIEEHFKTDLELAKTKNDAKNSRNEEILSEDELDAVAGSGCGDGSNPCISFGT